MIQEISFRMLPLTKLPITKNHLAKIFLIGEISRFIRVFLHEKKKKLYKKKVCKDSNIHIEKA